MVEQRTFFPRLEARDLTGAKRWLPEAFEAAHSLVFVAFRREQQASIDSWATWLATDAAGAGIAAYEVPVCESPRVVGFEVSRGVRV